MLKNVCHFKFCSCQRSWKCHAMNRSSRYYLDCQILEGWDSIAGIRLDGSLKHHCFPEWRGPGLPPISHHTSHLLSPMRRNILRILRLLLPTWYRQPHIVTQFKLVWFEFKVKQHLSPVKIFNLSQLNIILWNISYQWLAMVMRPLQNMLAVVCLDGRGEHVYELNQ